MFNKFKSFLSRKGRALAVTAAITMSMAVPAFADPATPAVSVTDINGVIAAVTGQISVANIMGVLVAGITAGIGFVFMWFGVRKLLKTVMAAFRKGKVSA